MLPYIVAIASIVALAASLYKDREIEDDTSEIKRALRVHHVAQFLLVCLALWSAIDSDSSARKYRIAQLDANASGAAARHTTSIIETYLLELLPAGTVIRNRERYQASLIKLPPELREKYNWKSRVSSELEADWLAGIRAFEKLQTIAREVLNEKVQYGERYPEAITKWAERTLEIKESELGDLLSNSPNGIAYAQFVSQATGVPRAKYLEATKRLEE